MTDKEIMDLRLYQQGIMSLSEARAIMYGEYRNPVYLSDRAIQYVYNYATVNARGFRDAVESGRVSAELIEGAKEQIKFYEDISASCAVALSMGETHDKAE
jgi:hypothetical protein